MRILPFTSYRLFIADHVYDSGVRGLRECQCGLINNMLNMFFCNKIFISPVNYNKTHYLVSITYHTYIWCVMACVHFLILIIYHLNSLLSGQDHIFTKTGGNAYHYLQITLGS